MLTGLIKKRHNLRTSLIFKSIWCSICIVSLVIYTRSTFADDAIPESLPEEPRVEKPAYEQTCSSCECSGPDFWNQTTLTENLFQRRPCLAEQGITFDADVSQFYMGVASGGAEQEFRYAGHGDYVMNIDSGKLGGPQGLFVKLRAEHRFGESINNATGAIIPANILPDLPVADRDQLYLTNVLFTQMFSESFGVFAGKMDTLDGDMNAFAHGRGKTQFTNAAFVATPIGLRTIVYSSLGAGFLIMQEGEPIFTFTVINSTDTSRTSGFDELFANGASVIPELRLPTNLFGRPGHFLEPVGAVVIMRRLNRTRLLYCLIFLSAAKPIHGRSIGTSINTCSLIPAMLREAGASSAVPVLRMQRPTRLNGSSVSA